MNGTVLLIMLAVVVVGALVTLVPIGRRALATGGPMVVNQPASRSRRRG